MTTGQLGRPVEAVTAGRKGSELCAIVMAAGRGTRMKSRLAKVLHRVRGRPLLFYPVRAALDLGAEEVNVVVSEDILDAVRDEMAKFFPAERLSFSIQRDMPGTGGAALAGLAGLSQPAEQVLILNGDLPLVRVEDLAPLRRAMGEGCDLALLSFIASQPQGYGRVLRDAAGEVHEIREQKDLRSDAEERIAEVNAGTYLVRQGALRRALDGLTPNNAQGEYYLTDIVRHLAEFSRVAAVDSTAEAALGVNDRTQLRQADQALGLRLREEHEARGVTFGHNVQIDFGVDLGADVRLEEGVRLRGEVKIGAGTLVDVGCVIENSSVGQNAEIKPYCVIADSVVGDACAIGPFAHLRPESIIEAEAKIGNFVETKKTRIRRGAKANHLAYLGDADVGEGANLGAGVIVCNYDGFMKRRTVIGRDVFVGSDSQLIAPVTLGDGAYVATGTTVSADVPEGALAIGRVRQVNKEGYATRLRENLAERAAGEKKALQKK